MYYPSLLNACVVRRPNFEGRASLAHFAVADDDQDDQDGRGEKPADAQRREHPGCGGAVGKDKDRRAHQHC